MSERIRGAAGELLLDRLRAHHHHLRAPCAGIGSCGKCRVRIAAADAPLLAPPGDPERSLLGDADLAAGLRLACRARFSVAGTINIEREPEALHCAGLGSMPPVAPEARHAAAASGRPLRIAIDIGTTTLAAVLADAAAGAILAEAGQPNAQKAWGSDVVSRIQCALDDPGAAQAMRAAIRAQLAELASRLLASAGAAPDRVGGVTIAGNTAMLHILEGADLTGLARMPFQPVFLAARTGCAADYSLPLPADCPVTLLPGISAFVGADISAGIAATGLGSDGAAELLVDLGTNGEMALAQGGRLLATATAAGPAFEGGQIRHGMPGLPGALDHAWWQDGTFGFSTIGEAPVAGICGSGLIDLAAALRRMGLLDETGLLEGPEPDGSFRPDPASPVCLSPADVRQLQLAKGAVAAGIEVLCRRAGISPADLARVHLAGGFGGFLVPGNAVAIGLLPPAVAGRIEAAGNTALRGALAAACDPAALSAMTALAERTVTIDLSTDPEFQMAFAEAMLFPEDPDA